MSTFINLIMNYKENDKMSEISDNFIKTAVIEANAMSTECQQRIDVLKSIQKIYAQLGKSKECDNNSNTASAMLHEFVKKVKENDESFPIQETFNLIMEHGNSFDIENEIQEFTKEQEKWSHIAKQLQ